MKPAVLLIRPDQHDASESLDLEFLITRQPDAGGAFYDTEFTLSEQELYELQQQILSLVLGYSPHLIKSGNRLFMSQGEVVPNQLILHEKLARYLAGASLIAVLVALASSLFVPASSTIFGLANLGYQAALCLCLLGYFGIFVRIQAYRPEDLSPGWPIVKFLDTATRSPFILLIASVALLLLSIGVRIMGVIVW